MKYRNLYNNNNKNHNQKIIYLNQIKIKKSQNKLQIRVKNYQNDNLKKMYIKAKNYQNNNLKKINKMIKMVKN